MPKIRNFTTRLPGWFWPIAGICIYWVPLYLLQQDMYDGAPLAFAFEHKVYEGFREWQLNSAWHLAYAYHMAIFSLAQWLDISRMLLVKLALLAAFAGLYFQYRWYLREVFRLGGGEATVFAFLASLFISPQIYAASLGTMLPVLVLAGLTGYRLMHSPGAGRMAAGLLLVLVSFQLTSMLVFVLALHMGAMISSGTLRRRDWVLLAVLTAAGVLFFLGRKWAFAPSGPYATYNAIRLPADWNSIRSVLRAGLMFLTWLIVPLTALVASLVWIRLRGAWQFRGWAVLREPLWMRRCAVALLLFASAAFPYAMVAKGPPLFTATAIGSGITEQALRAYYSGPLAPGFSLTSGRHGVLLMLSVAMLLHLAMFLPGRLFGRHDHAMTARSALVFGLVAMLPWILGGAWNRLVQQRAEIALARGLAALPAPPPGVIDIHYSPVTDWLVHTDTANQIAARAWGSPRYFAMIYALPAYQRELHWQYNAFFKAIGGLEQRWIQQAHSLIDFPGERCISRYRAVLPGDSAVETLLGGLRPALVTPAAVTLEQSQCLENRRIDNPMPDRPASY